MTAADGPRRAVWGGRQGMAALAVLAATAIWRGVLLRDSFFNQDDYYLAARGAASELGWDYLLRDTAGHVNPGQQIAFWTLSRVAAFDWGSVALFVLAMQLLTTVALWHVLTRMLPGSWVRVLLLAVFSWSPLTLATTLWWSAAMALWPHVFFSVLAVLMWLRSSQGAGPRWLNRVGCLLALCGGLLWHERAVLIPAVVFGVAVAMADDASGWRRLPRALRRDWPLWLGHALVLGGFLFAHSRLTTVEGGGSSVRESFSITWAFIAENVLPGLLAGPWAGGVDGGAVVPAVWVPWVAVALTVIAVVLLLRVGGPGGWWALVLLVGYIAADLTLLLAGRGGFGRVIALDPRYSSDILHVAVLSVAVAIRGHRVPDRLRLGQGLPWADRRAAILLGLGTAYLVGSVLGTAVLVPHFQNQDDREWLTNLRADLAADGDQVVFDELVPEEILLPLLGREALASQVLGPLPERPFFDRPSARLRRLTDSGNLVPITLDGWINARPGRTEGCGHAVREPGTSIPMEVPVSGRLAVEVGYFTDRESTVEVTTGDWSARFQTVPGPSEMWFVLPDFEEPVRSLRMRLVDSDATVCVTGLRAGYPEGS
ncbi:hypothetical protein [Nocardioides pacificus]